MSNTKSLPCPPVTELLQLTTPLLAADHADALLAQLLTDAHWQQPQVRVYGRTHPVPRRVAWYADAGTDYGYSGQRHHGSGWPDWLQPLKQAVELASEQRFNAVLINLYRDGKDCMGYHRDNEPELGPTPWIASYSLGASRDFVFRPISGNRRQCHSLPLGHNQLLLMAPAVQQHYEHALPRRARQHGPRINLTFRLIL